MTREPVTLASVVESSPLLDGLETACWLRLCAPDATADEASGAVRAVQRLVRAGRLRPVVPGKAYLFDIDELRRFVRDETAAWTPREKANGDEHESTTPE